MGAWVCPTQGSGEGDPRVTRATLLHGAELQVEADGAGAGLLDTSGLSNSWTTSSLSVWKKNPRRLPEMGRRSLVVYSLESIRRNPLSVAADCTVVQINGELSAKFRKNSSRHAPTLSRIRVGNSAHRSVTSAKTARGASPVSEPFLRDMHEPTIFSVVVES